MSFGHAMWVTVLGVGAVVVAYWIFSWLAGFLFTLGKIALAVIVVAGIIWLVSRVRH